MFANMSLGAIFTFQIEYDAPVWKEHGFSGSLVCLGGKQIEKGCRGLPFDMALPGKCGEKSVIEGWLGTKKPELYKNVRTYIYLYYLQLATDAFNGPVRWIPKI